MLNLARRRWAHENTPTAADVDRDVDAIIEGFRLQQVRRFFGQVHWTEETEAAQTADRAEPGLKLENAAAHSWHVADAALLLCGHFAELNRSRVIELALLHDKLEIYTGDYDPVGPDGQGTETHAFSDRKRIEKEREEKTALERYLSGLRDSARDEQRSAFVELIEGSSSEALFVKAVDKLQALAFVCVKKAGAISREHLCFTIKYSAKSKEYFPQLTPHYDALIARLCDIANEPKVMSVAITDGQRG